MLAMPRRGEDWTFEDLERTPDDGRRYEILDGALVVSPSPRLRHQFVSTILQQILNESGTPEFMALGPLNVDLDPSFLEPDLTLVTMQRAMRDAVKIPAHDVLLAVEIVSPSSRTMDRLVKPQKYAEYGIPSYWRVETDPVITLVAHDLDGDVYRIVGSWGPGETAVLERPFPLTIEIDAIPRPA